MQPMTTRREPDPSRGIFETMLVFNGTPVALEAHLSRLEASLADVYGANLPMQIRQLVAERAGGLELGRLRLTFTPSGGIEVESGEIDRSLHFPKHPISLCSRAVGGGLGCHKWADRAAIPPGDENEATLLLDDGEVLEVDRANVFAVRKGTLFTPPLDGRILPGVTRATVIELARAEGIGMVEGALASEELHGSEEVFLTNSIRGIEAVGSIDGEPLAGETPLTHHFASALQRRWESEATARRRPLRTSV